MLSTNNDASVCEWKSPHFKEVSPKLLSGPSLDRVNVDMSSVSESLTLNKKVNVDQNINVKTHVPNF